MINDVVLAEKIGIEKRCGYWSIGGLYFFDKVECLRYASQNKITNIKYHFFDSAFNLLDWSKEPSETLPEMYKTRAQQLRDEYDYLILCFSGGADSTNILRTFTDNNIRLDEIFCDFPVDALEKTKHKFTYNGNDPAFVSFEWYTSAKPDLERLSKTHPEIKLSIYQTNVNEIVSAVENNEYHKYARSSIITPLPRFHKLYELARERSKYGRVACIYGVDKPRISYNAHTRKFYSKYSDFTNSFSVFSSDLFSDSQLSVEFFYYSYNYPQLNQKMSFAIKNSVIGLAARNDMNEFKTLLQSGHNQFYVFEAHHDHFKKALYGDNWDSNKWQAKKPSDIFHAPSHQWFFDPDLTSNTLRESYDKQLLELLHGIDGRFIRRNVDGTPASFAYYFTDGIAF